MTAHRSKSCTQRRPRSPRGGLRAQPAPRRIDTLPPEVREVIAVMVEVMLRERRRVRAAGASPETSPELQDGS
jgi:hypothetical protein